MGRWRCPTKARCYKYKVTSVAFSAVGNVFSSVHSVELTLIEGIHFRSNLKIAQNNGTELSGP